MPSDRPLGLRADAARRGLIGYGSLFSLAACVGVLGALAALGFRHFEERILALTLGAGESVLTGLRETSVLSRLLLPAAGILAAAAVVRLLPGGRGAGLDLMEVTVLRRGPMPFRRELLRVLAALGVIGTGGSVGPEGPVVELGAALGSSFATATTARRRDASVFASCGAAAGLAAAFNAPIGAAMFVLEIMIGRLAVDRFAPVVVASVTATAVTHAARGSDPVFEVGDLGLRSSWEYLPVVVLGILGGLLGATFLRALEEIQKRARSAIPAWWLRAAVGGLILGGVGLFLPQVLGSGIEGVNLALAGGFALGVCGLLVIAKMLATAVTLGAGGLGGVFLPTLFVGAVLGCGFGALVHTVTPGPTAAAGAYALVGMASLVGATLHAPVTAILLVFELSRDYELVPAVMLATITATVIARRLHPWSLYTQKLRKRGVGSGGGEGDRLLAATTVAAVMDPPPATLPASAPLAAVLARVESGAEVVYVRGPGGELAGSVAASVLAGVDVAAVGAAVVAGDMALPARTLPTEAVLAEALAMMDALGGDEVPVVDPSGRLLGLVTRRAILRRLRAGA